jgi:methionyl aminopeptidase
MIFLKSEKEINLLRQSNRLVALVLTELEKMVKPGVTTLMLDKRAEEIIRSHGAIPAFKGYKGRWALSSYPNTITASVNHHVVHGIPNNKKLKEGDIVSIDVGVKLNGYYGDAAVTLPVGKISNKAQRLLDVTREALRRGIEQAVIGNRIGDISFTIQSYVESQGFSVVRDWTGHGIGKALHEDPQVPHFGPPHHGPRIKKGLVIAIEPMINAGSYEVEVLEDGWTVVTKDRSLSAQFEHTVAINDNGPEILSTL